MTKFSVKNIIIYWLKMWPITLVLLVLGAGVGVMAATEMQQSYKTAASVLVVNEDANTVSSDYVGVLNSQMLLGRVGERLDGAGGCTLLSSGVGNVLTISTSCTSNEEDSVRFTEMAIEVFTEMIKELYGYGDIKITKLSGELVATESVSRGDYIAQIAMPIGAALVLSAVAAFVRFDYVNGKQRKK